METSPINNTPQETSTKTLLKDSLGWGFLLWLIGYILGIVLFFVFPPDLIGWIISPIGLAIMIWVLLKRIKNTSFKHYIILSIVWTAIAIILDYFLLVQLLKPADGYYKLDVYLYYILTFVTPLIIGWWKQKNS